MIICPAKNFDLTAIMQIEHQAFIPQIQEKKKIFEKRMKVFPEGFFVLCDNSQKILQENKIPLTCGYLCCERWDFSIEDENSQKDLQKLYQKRFSLGHNPEYTHKKDGNVLYISSFAILNNYKGQGLGKKFFIKSVETLCSSMSDIKKIFLLVNSEWKNAIKIYSGCSFTEVLVLKDFFPSLQKKVYSDGIIMQADSFHFIEENQKSETESKLENENFNIFQGINLL